MAETPRASFEPADITRPWLVGGAVAGFFLFAVALMAILLAIYFSVAPKPRPPERFPEPQLQSHPQADFRDFLRAQKAKLEQSGWIDKSSGVAAIPIDKAMAIIAGRGRSAFDPLPAEGGKDAAP